ncbi:hypothetical protein ACFPYI_06920 [Halomarina salina]|uniref:Uncharacterized protein n=1 Tax=Halomarina salina TaxID=1872699 RepID=A0ABD5RL13_9EURY|nr:hypothetical protein [Halomarina salina]
MKRVHISADEDGVRRFKIVSMEGEWHFEVYSDVPFRYWVGNKKTRAEQIEAGKYVIKPDEEGTVTLRTDEPISVEVEELTKNGTSYER